MTLTFRFAGTSLAVLLLGLVGCSGTEAEAGFGLPTLSHTEMQSAASAPGSTFTSSFGTLRVESNGCFTFEDSDEANGRRAWIVWPDTAHQDGSAVVLGSGVRLGQGDSLSGHATHVHLSDLPDGSNESSYFGSFGRFCDAGANGVVLFTDVHS